MRTDRRDGLYDGLCYPARVPRAPLVDCPGRRVCRRHEGPWTPSAQRERVDFSLTAIAPTATPYAHPHLHRQPPRRLRAGLRCRSLIPLLHPRISWNRRSRDKRADGRALAERLRRSRVCQLQYRFAPTVRPPEPHSRYRSRLAPLQVNHLRVCDENYNYCGGPAEACTSVEIIQTCAGDCGGTFSVTVDEILTVVNIALATPPLPRCATGDANDDGQITVEEILMALNNALSGCPSSLGPPCKTGARLACGWSCCGAGSPAMAHVPATTARLDWLRLVLENSDGSD